MNYVKHPTNNFTYTSPPDMRDRCGDLSVTRTELNGDPCIKSYWKPSEEDIANILAGGHVCLHIIGRGMPPVMLSVELV